MRTAAWRLTPIVLSAACGGTVGPPNPLVLGLLDASASPPDATATASSPADATTSMSSPADGAVQASGTGADATTGPTCTGGTWALAETAGACGGCPNISDLVALVVSDQTAAEGGAVPDDEGNTWTFDPLTCTATLNGACDASDTLDFARGTATCTWTCNSLCPPCPASCVLTPYP